MSQKLHWLLFLLLLTLQLPVDGHANREDYLVLSLDSTGGVEGRFEIHHEDLRKHLGVEVLDESGKPVVSLAKASGTTVQEYILSHFVVKADGVQIVPEFTEIEILDELGAFVQYNFKAKLAQAPSNLSVRHDMFYEGDEKHRGLVILSENVDGRKYGDYNIALIFTKSEREKELQLQQEITNLIEPPSFFEKGLRHMALKPDHLLLLFVFLLPVVLRRKDGTLEPEGRFLKPLGFVLAAATAFIIAHALALFVSSHLLGLPRRLVEVAVASAILVISLHNLYPRLRAANLILFIGCGFVHGTSYRAALGGIRYKLDNLNGESFQGLFLTFHTGAWIGLVATAALGFSILFSLRKSSRYESLILRGGSALGLLLAGYLLIDRALG